MSSIIVASACCIVDGLYSLSCPRLEDRPFFSFRDPVSCSSSLYGHFLLWRRQLLCCLDHAFKWLTPFINSRALTWRWRVTPYGQCAAPAEFRILPFDFVSLGNQFLAALFVAKGLTS